MSLLSLLSTTDAVSLEEEIEFLSFDMFSCTLLVMTSVCH